MDYVDHCDIAGSNPVNEELFLLRSTIIDLETMRTPYETSSRGFMALTTAISILKQMHDYHALAVNSNHLKLVKASND